ncbi:diaminopimelate epimerase [Luedemannella flava]|uniref:diaminopimelate epimerase n=1 Tax=Luedemannella flava TaxID=349316 RepID=UPI0031D391BB
MSFAKGHGTGNDFVVLPDPDGALALTPEFVAAVCDRRFGVGGDGVLRVVRTAAHPEVAHRAAEAEWFMDYWNSDGSLAAMCGNGVRVYSRYLVESGLAEGPTVTVLTRAGVVVAEVGAEVAVSMPLPSVGGRGTADVGGVIFTGTAATCGNPNLVCPVADLDTLSLDAVPRLDTMQFPESANVEFVVLAKDDVPGADLHVAMRVIERGSGETLSCGSGACAVAAVALAGGLGTDPLTEGTVAIDVPGGRVTVSVSPDRCVLSGPAVLVATGEIDLASLRA